MMGRFELIASRVAQLAPSQQDALADLVEAALREVDRAGASTLNVGQIAELSRLLAEPEALADEAEVDALFESFVRPVDR